MSAALSMPAGGTLELSGIQAGYGDFQALFGVGLRVEPGEAVGVVGPNGAGKTTLLRVISGLIRPRAGTLRYGGRDLTQVPPHELPGLGIAHVPENRRLFPHLTVEENLKVGAFTKSSRAHFAERRDRVYDLFPKMQQRRHQLAGTMSGGEQQMCAIGRGLMAKPSLLMIDELSLGLAPQAVELLLERLRDINRSGVAILLVEQDVMNALDLADRAYVIDRGRVTISAAAKDLAADPAIREAYLGLA